MDISGDYTYLCYKVLGPKRQMMMYTTFPLFAVLLTFVHSTQANWIMKTSSLLTFSLGSVLLPSLAHAGTYNTTNLFQISCTGTGFVLLDDITVALIETVMWTEFALFFGAYTELQPGQSIILNRRGRALSISVNEDENEEEEKGEDIMVEESENQAETEYEGKEGAISSASEQERNLMMIQTCPNNCYKKSNRLVCAYNGCAVKGNGRTRRNLREDHRKLGTFEFDLEGCVQAMNKQLLTLLVGILFNLKATIEVF